MNRDFNSWHPMPRYGLAAALYHLEKTPSLFFEEEELGNIAQKAIQESLNHFMLGPTLKHGVVHYHYLSENEVEPGKNSGQVSANGYFSAPHIITSNNAAGILKEAKNLIIKLQEGAYSKNYELKRSFAPMIAKINAGRASMSNPKVDLILAAFTAYATLTEIKPAAYSNGNTGLIPDIPFYDAKTHSFPLHQFISIFHKLQKSGLGSEAFTMKHDGITFYRPPIFKGNYYEAPHSMSIGAVPVIAAIGKWVEKQKIQRKKTEQVLMWLENRPIYNVSDAATTQESFGHHLVNLALDGELHNVLKHLNKVILIGVEDGKMKFKDTKWKLFIMHFDQFLRFFTHSSFQNFLSYRATYPIEFFTLLKTYFMNDKKYSEELITSAVVYGQSLNQAAYLSAKAENEDDIRKGRSSRGIKEYKHRILLQLESIIQSAKTNADLIARLNTQVGRLTMQDIPSDAKHFLLAVMNNEVDFEDAKNLITAFMRLGKFRTNDDPEQEMEAISSQSDLEE